MVTTRRQFIQTSFVAGGGLYLGLAGCAADGEPQVPDPLKILILGGTGFIGPHQVDYALSRGHTVTLFNRGITNPHLFPDVEKLVGDRNDNLEALKGREWDVVVDNPATDPSWVRLSAEVLRDSVQQYVFISTLSVFADDGVVDQDETGVVAVYDEEAEEAVTGSGYGGQKVLCERAAEEAFPGRTTVIRPSIITGPGDPTMRFPYWPVRVRRGGEVLVPGEFADPIQIITRTGTEWSLQEVLFLIRLRCGFVRPVISVGVKLRGKREETSLCHSTSATIHDELTKVLT